MICFPLTACVPTSGNFLPACGPGPTKQGFLEGRSLRGARCRSRRSGSGAAKHDTRFAPGDHFEFHGLLGIPATPALHLRPDGICRSI